MANILVCLAVWLSFSARSSIERIAAIIFPITAFVAAGFKHSIANMYFIPIGLLVKNIDPAFATSTSLNLSGLTWQAFFLNNLVPGNDRQHHRRFGFCRRGVLVRFSRSRRGKDSLKELYFARKC